jgi:hypothetical protein
VNVRTEGISLPDALEASVDQLLGRPNPTRLE